MGRKRRNVQRPQNELSSDVSTDAVQANPAKTNSGQSRKRSNTGKQTRGANSKSSSYERSSGAVHSGGHSLTIGHDLDAVEHPFVGNTDTNGTSDPGFRAFMMSQGTAFNLVGRAASHAKLLFQEAVWSNYVIGMRRVSNDRSVFSIAEFEQYVTDVIFLMAEFYGVQAQIRYAQDNTACPELTSRLIGYYGPEVDNLMRRIGNTLTGMWCPPNVHAWVRWASGIFYNAPGKNAPIIQLGGVLNTMDQLSTVPSLNLINNVLQSIVLSAGAETMGSIFRTRPEWVLSLQDPIPVHYDEQFLNGWANRACAAGGVGLNPPLANDLNESIAVYRMGDNPIDLVVTPMIGGDILASTNPLVTAGSFPGLMTPNGAAPVQITYDAANFGETIGDVTFERLSGDHSIWHENPGGDVPQGGVRQVIGVQDLLKNTLEWFQWAYQPDLIAGAYARDPKYISL